MSDNATPISHRPLPPNPNLRHLKDEARAVLRGGGTANIAEAQDRIAQEYGFADWLRLKAHIEALGLGGNLKAAIDSNDLEQVIALMTRHPGLHTAPIGYAKNGPLTWAAECRIPWEPPGETRLAIAQWMIDNGSNVHQGGDGPLMRAALRDDRIPMMELLVASGADVDAKWNGAYPIICAPCETLAPNSLQWLIDHGADPRVVSSKYGSPLSMVLGSYSRNAKARQACLKVFERAGFDLPDTPVMALHRGRTDLLDSHISRDPQLLSRQFAGGEIAPVDLGLDFDHVMCGTPIGGATLLHLAVEYGDIETTEWLLDKGADPNARAAVNADGFGGQTPIFHAVVTLAVKDDKLARLLLDRGAAPNAAATIRKQLRDMGDPNMEEVREFRDVTPIAYANKFRYEMFVNTAAIAAVREFGGA